MPGKNNIDVLARANAAMSRYEQSQSPTLKEQEDILDIGIKGQNLEQERIETSKAIETYGEDIQKTKDEAAIKAIDLDAKQKEQKAGGMTLKEYLNLSPREKVEYYNINPDSPFVRKEYIEQLEERIAEEDEAEIAKAYDASIRQLQADLNERIGTGQYEAVDYEAYNVGGKLKNKTALKEIKEYKFPEGSIERTDKLQQLHALMVERDVNKGFSKLRKRDPETGRIVYTLPNSNTQITEEEYLDRYEQWANPITAGIIKEIKDVSMAYYQSSNLISPRITGSNGEDIAWSIDKDEYERRISDLKMRYDLMKDEGDLPYEDLANKYGFIYDEFGKRSFLDMADLKSKAYPVGVEEEKEVAYEPKIKTFKTNLTKELIKKGIGL